MEKIGLTSKNILNFYCREQINPPEKTDGVVIHSVNSSSPEGPKDSFFDPHSDYISPHFSVKPRDYCTISAVSNF